MDELMDKKIKVLLLVAEPWRKDDSGGNTIDNFFYGMKGVEFAQVYCDDRLPHNDVCTKYFQISQEEVLKSFLGHRKVGGVLSGVEIQNQDTNIQEQEASQVCHQTKINKIKVWIRNLRPASLLLMRSIIWRYSNWKTEELDKFILDFNPDVIYAPCYAFPFQLALTRHVKKLTGLKIITWSADDCYSLRQFNLDPFFWINRFWNRHCLRKTYPCYNEFYSISEDEIEEMSPVVGLPMKILRKGVRVPDSFTPREVHKPIKFIYAGGMYINRHKSLIKIADAIRKLNEDGSILAELHIYSATQLDSISMALLNDGRSVFNHGLISAEQLSKLYLESDVAIHCESFDLQNRLGTRLSFSTKIIDCFQSGCAILAIAWKEHTALKYLQKEDAALCVTSNDDIESTVFRIVQHPEIIKEYAQKAYECEKRNHRIEDVQKKLYDAFVRNSKA